ncbi:MAG: hypothetical protein BAJATHORv1_70060 [Candidatus Thorarchaeota archaeon]|nr:MAG: hypothetical protein BAJATHORv1_70060 [Candidatus Thorarchaeota archaeon]
MAIAIYKKRRFPDGTTHKIRQYIVESEPLTGKDKEFAKELERNIRSHIRDIESRLEKEGLLQNTDRIHLWYTIGEELRFVDDLDLSPKIRPYIWLAIQEQVDKLEELMRLESDAENPRQNEFYYSYLLREFRLSDLQRGGEWGDWVELLKIMTDIDYDRTRYWITKLEEIDVDGNFWLKDIVKGLRELMENSEPFDDKKVIETFESVASQSDSMA